MRTLQSILFLLIVLAVNSVNAQQDSIDEENVAPIVYAEPQFEVGG